MSKSKTPDRGLRVKSVVRRPIAERIKENYRRGIGYHELMRKVFPFDEYPRAWEYQANGGPPGCVMAFGKALRKLGLMRRLSKMGIDTVEKTKDCAF
jgi:hypothetical protein